MFLPHPLLSLWQFRVSLSGFSLLGCLCCSVLKHMCAHDVFMVSYCLTHKVSKRSAQYSAFSQAFSFICHISLLCSSLQITYWLATALHAELLNCCGLSASVWFSMGSVWVYFFIFLSLLFVAEVCICLVMCSVLEQGMQDLNFVRSLNTVVSWPFCWIWLMESCISMTFPWNHLELPATMPVTHTEYVSVHTSLFV